MDNIKTKQQNSENTSIHNIIQFLEISELNSIKTLMKKDLKPQILCLLYIKIISPTYVIGGSSDKTIKIWDIVKDTCIKTLTGHTNQVNCLLFMKLNENFKILSGSDDTTIKIWEWKSLESVKCIKTLSFHIDSVYSIINFPDYDKSLIASGSADSDIKLFNITKGECLKTLKGHTGSVMRLLNLQEIKSCLLSTGEDKTLKIWNLETEICIKTKIGHGDMVLDLILVDTETLATCGKDAAIVLWGLKPFEIKNILTGHKGTIRCLVSLNDKIPGIMLSASEDKTVKTWNKDKGECINTLQINDFFINCFAFLNDYSKHDIFIASGNTNGIVQLMKF